MFDGVMLDRGHSNALLDQAFREGLVLDKSGSLDRRDVGNVLDRKYTWRHRRRALQLAVLFQNVDLSSVPDALDLSKLRDAGLVRLKFDRGNVVEEVREVNPAWARFIAPFLVKDMARSGNLSADIGRVPHLGESFYEAALHSLIDVLPEIDLKDFHRRLVRLVASPQELLDESASFANLLIDFVGHGMFLAEREGVPLTVDMAATYLPAVTGILLDQWTLFAVTQIFDMPFVSALKLPTDEPFLTYGDAGSKAFQLCQVGLQDIVGFYPDVRSVNDVMRLRKDPRIVRFREVLEEFTVTIANEGTERALKQIRSEIQGASAELERLDKVRRVERFFFWTQVPAALIPVLSTIVSVCGVVTGLAVHSTERRSSWIRVGS